jgi:hypothetical protein
MNQFLLHGFAESIGLLLLKIGGTVKKLFRRAVFDKKWLVATLDWNFEKFENFQLCFRSFTESIGVLRAKFGGRVKLLFKEEFSQKLLPCSHRL